MNDIKVITDPEEGGPSWAYQVPVCQPGLEELIHIDELVVHHQMELVEVSSGWETEKSIKVKNRTGQELYIAYEDSGMCNAQLCGVNRAFVIQITDNINQFSNDLGLYVAHAEFINVLLIQVEILT
ncbi:phospholipid scramblase 1-like [Glandiceps talaboti]